MDEKTQFLDRRFSDLAGPKKDDKHSSKSVQRATQIARNTGETINTREERIDAYLDRLERVFAKGNWRSENRGLELLKHKIFDQYVTKDDDIPESYWKGQERIIEERGQRDEWSRADDEQKEQLRKEHAESVINDQRASLEQWIDYFASPDSQDIPKQLKYWIFRSVLSLSEYNKENKKFPKRSKGTLKQFPDINYEALRYVVDAVLDHIKGKDIEFDYYIQPDEQADFRKFLQKEDFSKLYAWANELMQPIPEHLLPITDGEWKKYDHNSDSHALTQTIRGKGTGWCTAGENTAKTQLQGGDFYVFYSNDDEGNPTLPRIAIRMEDEDIAEVRGVAYKQNIDPYIAPVLEEKLSKFGTKGEKYKKQTHDMEKMTELVQKQKDGQDFTKEDLLFLYETESSIEGFGYQKDPRIKELRSTRNVDQDMLVIFECEPGQVAHVPHEINENIKAYVGPLEPGIFDTLPDSIEHVYTSFPDRKISKEDIGIVPEKTGQQWIAELEAAGINISDYAKHMLASSEFTSSNENEPVILVKLRVGDLGFTRNATTEQIYQRAEELGLELCPASLAPHYRTMYKDQPFNEWVRVAMKPISDPDGHPDLFLIERDDGGLWLINYWASPDSQWLPHARFVFRLRKSES